MKKIFFITLALLSIYNVYFCQEMYTYTVIENEEVVNKKVVTETTFFYDKYENKCTVLPHLEHNFGDPDLLAEFYLKHIQETTPEERALFDSLVAYKELFFQPLETRFPELIKYLDEEDKKMLSDKIIFLNEKQEICVLVYSSNNAIENNFVMRKANLDERKLFIKIMAIKKTVLQKALKKNLPN